MGPMTGTDPVMTLLAAAAQLEQMAARTTGGQWRLEGLLATRPEIVAHHPDGSTEHVAEARSGTARWIRALSPEVAPALVGWLRAAAHQDTVDAAALRFAQTLLDQTR